MKSYIFAAVAALGAVAQGAVVRRTDPNCDQPSGVSGGGAYSNQTTNTAPGDNGTAPGSITTPTSGLPCGATSSTNYTVVSGDTLNKISAASGAGVCDIASLNHLADPNSIQVGQVLVLPVGCTSIDNSTCVPPPAPNATETCVPGLPDFYLVQSGDTLTSIASDFNITLASLEAANAANIPNFNAIDVGQQINIPVCPTSECEAVGTYNIASGDVFVSLATTYRTTVGQIKALNPSVVPSKLAIGQQIILPRGCHNITVPANDQ